MLKNYKKGLSKGFTLIELLVVIAIIGILASVVLISTSATRSQGGDTAIKSNLATIKLQSEILLTNEGCYGEKDDVDPSLDECNVGFTPVSDCTDTMFSLEESDASSGNASDTIFDKTITKALISAVKSSGRDSDKNKVICAVGGNGSRSFAVAVPLKSDPTKSWCVDSDGYSDVVESGADLTSGVAIVQDTDSSIVSCVQP